MAHFVGLDVSKQTTSVCILDELGKVVREGVVETSPAAIISFLRGDRRRYRRIGMESISFAPWIYEGLAKAGLPVICIEARHALGVLKARINKNDRNDALGIAELMRVGIYKAVHIKTSESREAKLILTTRRILKRKQNDLDGQIRSALLEFGLKLAPGKALTFAGRALELARLHSALLEVVSLLLDARNVIGEKISLLEAHVQEIVRADAVCQRFLTVPGIGPITALEFKAAIDVPDRFARSRSVGVYLGLTPRAFRSGTIRRQAGISKCGDESVRSALFLAARSVLRKSTRESDLQKWGQALRMRKNYFVAAIAVARRLAVILHRMWIDGVDFNYHPSKP